MMAPLSVTVGLMLLSVALWDAFSTVVLPRTGSVALRPARLFYGLGWRLWRFVGSRFSDRRTRQSFLTTFEPLSVFLLLGLWALMIIVAYALLHFGLRTELNPPASQGGIGWFLYLSGTTFFTIGLGDVVPMNTLRRVLIVAEVGTGIIFLGMIIGYLPMLEQAYAQREVGVHLLESRAGSPQSAVLLLQRFGRPESAQVLATVLQEAERWALAITRASTASLSCASFIIASTTLVFSRAARAFALLCMSRNAAFCTFGGGGRGSSSGAFL